jgi:hypothetical protein
MVASTGPGSLKYYSHAIECQAQGGIPDAERLKLRTALMFELRVNGGHFLLANGKIAADS